MRPLRILIADDHDVVRQGVRSYLEKHPDWVVVGEASTGCEAVELAKEHRPDIVIMDISMPELNGLDATRRILADVPRTQVLVLTMHESESTVRTVLESGARGYILKSSVTRDMIHAVEALAAGKPYITPDVSQKVLQQYLRMSQPTPAESASHLTTREREVLQFLAQGKTNKEIASELKVSVRTVETHRANLMEKLQLHSLADLVRYAIQNRITA